MNIRDQIIKISELIDDSTLRRLRVKPRSVRLARERAAFPASWFVVIKEIAEENGLACPHNLFTFK